MTEQVVVVGGSLSGVRTVQALRRKKFDGPIVLVGAEDELPYDRPPLSKEILLGTKPDHSIRLADQAQLDELGVQVLLGAPASALDPDRRTVLVGDRSLGYDALVIATGSSPRTLPFAAGVGGVFVLRTFADALALRAAMASARHVVIVGGGFIGCEIASAARSVQADVTVVDPLPALMSRGVGTALGARMGERHRAAGVHLRLGRGVTALRSAADGTVDAVVLDDGTELPADLVVIGVGARPNTDWLAGSGLPVEDGVLCDATLQAAPGIYAVGDVARWAHPRYGSIRMEHWTSATEHALAVAATLTGTPTEVASVPYVWSDQFGQKLQIAGHIDEDADLEFLVDEPDRFVVRAVRDGAPRGVVALAAPREFVRERMALNQAVPAAG